LDRNEARGRFRPGRKIMLDREQKQEVENIVREAVKNNDTESFRDRRTVDTPTDSYSIVNRRYVTLNGAVTSRPRSSVATIGQPYFATDTFIPMTFDGNDWRNGVGSIVAVGRN